jgi:hypothetical protein
MENNVLGRNIFAFAFFGKSAESIICMRRFAAVRE